MVPNTRSVIGIIPNSSQGGTSDSNLVDDNVCQLLGELVDERMSRLERALEGLSSQVAGLAIQNQHLGNVNRGNQLHHTRLAKIEFPKFSDEDVRGWVFRCEQFFNLDQVTDEEKVNLISIHLYDKALFWRSKFIKNHEGLVSWEVYKQVVLARFGNIFDDPMSELKNLKYETSAKEYEDAFDELLSRV
ncbi:reverse transcriptase [Tanacetum coccineum]